MAKQYGILVVTRGGALASAFLNGLNLHEITKEQFDAELSSDLVREIATKYPEIVLFYRQSLDGDKLESRDPSPIAITRHGAKVRIEDKPRVLRQGASHYVLTLPDRSNAYSFVLVTKNKIKAQLGPKPLVFDERFNQVESVAAGKHR